MAKKRSASRKAKQVGDAVRSYAESADIYESIDRHVYGATPTSGACWPFAVALAEVFDAPMLAVVEGNHPDTAQHVVVGWNGGYLDADGWSTKVQLLRRWSGEGVRRPRLVPFDGARTDDLVCPVGLVNEFVHGLLTSVHQVNPVYWPDTTGDDVLDDVLYDMTGAPDPRPPEHRRFVPSPIKSPSRRYREREERERKAAEKAATSTGLLRRWGFR